MKEELKIGISNYLKKFNKYSREEYIDLEVKRVDNGGLFLTTIEIVLPAF